MAASRAEWSGSGSGGGGGGGRWLGPAGGLAERASASVDQLSRPLIRRPVS